MMVTIAPLKTFLDKLNVINALIFPFIGGFINFTNVLPLSLLDKLKNLSAALLLSGILKSLYNQGWGTRMREH